MRNSAKGEWTPATRIRPATPEEVQTLVALGRDLLHGEALSANQLRRLIFKGDDAVLLFEGRGRTLGYAVVLVPIASSTARLHSLAVRADVRGHGIARALIGAAEERAGARGRTLMRLDAAVDDEIIRGLYRSLGYHPFGLLSERAGAVRFEKRFTLSPNP